MLCALQNKAIEYRRREPEQDLVHRVLVEHLETFLDRSRTEYHGLPGYVENELRDYVKCGVLAYGFLRVRCLKRTFKFKIEICPHCAGQMRIVAAIEDSASIKRYLDGTNEDSTPPVLKPARPPPQSEFDYEYEQAN